MSANDHIGDVARVACQIAEVFPLSDATLRSLSDNLPADMVYQVERRPDGEMRFVYVSAAVERLHGLTAEEVMVDSRSLFNQVLEEDRPAHQRAREESLMSMAPFNVVVRVRRKDGEVRWMHLCSAPRRLPGGRVIWDGVERDVTQTKLAEQELQWRRTFLEAQVHSSLDGIVVVDTSGKKILQNQRMVDLWNIPESIAADPDHRAQLEYLLGQIKRSQFLSLDYVRGLTNEIIRDEIELISGQVFDSYSAPVFDKDGKSYGRIWTFRDLTKRKQAEERIDLLQSITMDIAKTEDLPSAFKLVLQRLCEKTGWSFGQAWVLRREQSVLESSAAWYPAGSNLEEFRRCSLGRTFAIGEGLPGRVVATRRAHWIRDVTKELNFPRAEVADRVGLKAGLGVPILAKDQVVAVLEFFMLETREQDGRLMDLTCAIATQIGLAVERKLAEEKLRENEAQLRLLLNSTAEGIFGVDLNGNCTFCNSASLQLLGFDQPSELLSQDMHTLVASRRSDGSPYPKEECPVVRSLTTGEQVHSDADVFWRKNQTQFPVAYSAYPIRQKDQQFGAVITFQDITERRRAEKEVRDSRERLRALAGRLQAVREEERTRIAREIHDVLAQELTRLKIDLGWLSKRLDPAAKELDRDALSKRVASLSTVADSAIVTVQKIAAELRPVVLDSLGLAAAIEWQAEEFQKRTGIQCDAIVTEEELELEREGATSIFRIVQESLTNVIRHAAATKVEIILELEAGQLRLVVQDNGVGFDETKLKDPYSLGLLGMRERVSMLDGRFEIRGQRGKGTQISVLFPVEGKRAANIAHLTDVSP